jgi:NADPH-dependent ferric siderophore reductase
MTLSSLTSEARIPMADPTGFTDKMIEFLAVRDVPCERRDNVLFAKLMAGPTAVAIEADAIRIRVEADEQGRLESARSLISFLVLHLAGEDNPPTIRWIGHEPQGDTFANFREMRLRKTIDVTPHMRRLTFTGNDLARFANDDDLHVRLYFPKDGVEKPEWPRPGPDGRPVWASEERKPVMRTYTIRRIDTDAGEVDIDFVVHDNAGPGSAFAMNARPGALCGMAGPLGRSLKPARWNLLAGDETALPAIARILEKMPATAAGHAFIEIADRYEEIPLLAPPGIAITWLHRNGAAAGSTTLLTDAARNAQWPDHADVFAWVACEIRAVRTIREQLRKTQKLTREQHLAVAYWGVPQG